ASSGKISRTRPAIASETHTTAELPRTATRSSHRSTKKRSARVTSSPRRVVTSGREVNAQTVAAIAPQIAQFACNKSADFAARKLRHHKQTSRAGTKNII